MAVVPAITSRKTRSHFFSIQACRETSSLLAGLLSPLNGCQNACKASGSSDEQSFSPACVMAVQARQMLQPPIICSGSELDTVWFHAGQRQHPSAAECASWTETCAPSRLYMVTKLALQTRQRKVTSSRLHVCNTRSTPSVIW